MTAHLARYSFAFGFLANAVACSQTPSKVDAAGSGTGGSIAGESSVEGGSAGRPGSGGTGTAGAAGKAAGGASGGAAGKGSAGSGTAGKAGPDPIPSNTEPGSCGLEHPAFCETFETPSPGGRGGDLDERLWHFARWGHETRQFFVRIPSTRRDDVVFPASFCGKTDFAGILPYNDVQVCDGIGADGTMSRQLNEVFHDQGDFGFNSMRIRQPFDFTDRPGTIVLDVDAKMNPLNLGHGWWIELFITEDPGPMPYHEAPTVMSYARNGVGFAFTGFAHCPGSAEDWNNEVSRVFVTRNHAIIHDLPPAELDHPSPRCFRVADGKLNRLKFVISKTRAEIWATDYDAPDDLRLVSSTDNLDLNFTRGYVHLQHAHYNAHKDGDVTPVQTFRWDNVGFDGPTYPTPRAYEVEDNDEPDIDETGGRKYGYPLTDAWKMVQIHGVDLEKALSATFDYNVNAPAGRVVEYRFNGGPVHSQTIRSLLNNVSLATNGVQTFADPVPLEELTEGDNTIEFRMAPPAQSFEDIGNMEVTVEISE